MENIGSVIFRQTGEKNKIIEKTQVLTGRIIKTYKTTE